MIPYQHQIDLAVEALPILKENGIVYIAAEERTGKTLASILLAESVPGKSVLVLTKKAALPGWQETLEAFKDYKKEYFVTNYHQAVKITKDYDLVILDEAHNYLSTFPKHGKLWKEVKPLCKQKPIIYMSATPNAQGLQQRYGQLSISSFSPWAKHKNFYAWFRLYGKPYDIKINGVPIRQYDKCDNALIRGTSDHLYVTKTRQELGFEFEPEDKIHWIKLNDNTKAVYNEVVEHNIVELSIGMLVCDTKSKLRFSLHQLEGGTIKINEDRFILANEEKIEHIKQHWGDSSDVVIMYNYIAEKDKLETHFKKARILQATSYAEGVDLHKYAHLVIYSQDFSTARHSQRRARQANKKRDTPIIVHHLLVKKAMSQQVYKTVSVNKKNFVDSVFERETI
tara:strand:- start:1500 stop:2690 length:1191 start_codon:yes stop_codon:yes gene_type:complete